MSSENKRFVAGDIVTISSENRTIRCYALSTDNGTQEKFAFASLVASQSRLHPYDVVAQADQTGLPITIDGTKVLRLSREAIATFNVSVVTSAQSALPEVLKRVALFGHDLECFSQWSQRQAQGHSKIGYQRAKTELGAAKRLSEVDVGESTLQFLQQAKSKAKSFDHER